MITLADYAQRWIGVAERTGADDNPQVAAWLEQAGLPHGTHDETPWCASFIRSGAWLLGLPIPLNPARARSWLAVGTPVHLEHADARVGNDIVVLWRGDHDDGSTGHVTVYAGLHDGRVWGWGGNQGDRVSLASWPVERILGIRRLA